MRTTRVYAMYYENNIMSTLSLVEVMAEFGVKKIVFSSSATVYGLNNPSPLVENMPTSATNPYGYTKVMLEQILRDLEVSDKEWSVVGIQQIPYLNKLGANILQLVYIDEGLEESDYEDDINERVSIVTFEDESQHLVNIPIDRIGTEDAENSYRYKEFGIAVG